MSFCTLTAEQIKLFQTALGAKGRCVFVVADGNVSICDSTADAAVQCSSILGSPTVYVNSESSLVLDFDD
jgi:hypothetical protein